MSRVMMLVGEQGATLAETRVDGEGPDADQMAEAQLREEALMSGFTDEEVGNARRVIVGDFKR